MKQKRFNVEQIVAVLKQAEAGIPLAELIRRVGIDARITLGIYGHVVGDEQHTAVQNRSARLVN